MKKLMIVAAMAIAANVNFFILPNNYLFYFFIFLPFYFFTFLLFYLFLIPPESARHRIRERHREESKHLRHQHRNLSDKG